MISNKVIWRDEEVTIFKTGVSESGNTIWRYYRKSKIPQDAPWEIIEDPDHEMLQMIAFMNGETVTKRYYVTPPDVLEDWMGTYVYLPSGHCIHCDPILYGSEDDEERNVDISQKMMDFVLQNKDQLFDKKI